MKKEMFQIQAICYYIILQMKNNIKINSSLSSLPNPKNRQQLNKYKSINPKIKQILQIIVKKVKILQLFYSSQKINKDLLWQWPNPVIIDQLRQTDVINIKNNIYFIGNISNNMIHGYGLILYGINRFYQGQFKNNFKHGYGIQYLPNGIYIGNYINNKPEGKGNYIWSNGQIYEGDFLAGLKHGVGKLISKNQIYQGQWKSNKPDGIGMLISKDSKYQGQICKGCKHGQGKQQFKNGDIYVGTYSNGKPEGYGQYMWKKNKSTYRGTFKNGIRHGKGILLQQGNVFQGYFLNDKKNGKGTFTWANGNYYFGNYFNDLRHGYGQMYWINGSWYKGQWRQGVQNGIGQQHHPNAPNRKGIYENNIFMLDQQVKSLHKDLSIGKKKLKTIQYLPSMKKLKKNNSSKGWNYEDSGFKINTCSSRKKTEPSIIPYFLRFSQQHKSIRSLSNHNDDSDFKVNIRHHKHQRIYTSYDDNKKIIQNSMSNKLDQAQYSGN